MIYIPIFLVKPKNKGILYIFNKVFYTLLCGCCYDSIIAKKNNVGTKTQKILKEKMNIKTIGD